MRFHGRSSLHGVATPRITGGSSARVEMHIATAALLMSVLAACGGGGRRGFVADAGSFDGAPAGDATRDDAPLPRDAMTQDAVALDAQIEADATAPSDAGPPADARVALDARVAPSCG